MSDRPAWKEDLLREETLYEVYIVSLSFPKQVGNKVTLLLGSLACSLFALLPAFLFENYDSLSPIERVIPYATTLSASILGFLIAGFSIFAVLSDDKILIEMAKTPYGDSQHSIFKIIFYNFLSAFFVFLILLVFCGIYTSISGFPVHVAFDFFSIGIEDRIVNIANGVALSFFLILNVYALIKLKSFILGVYQGFLTILLSRDIIDP